MSSNYPKYFQNVPIWAQYGPKWTQMSVNERKSAQMSLNKPKWAQILIVFLPVMHIYYDF